MKYVMQNLAKKLKIEDLGYLCKDLESQSLK